ncbi:uncharacterized protein TNCV_5007171 [Trichonephila clavipes]|nr:uncharacterized protein TNCV_5007171 [Trichonephila clavipes]
MGKIFTGRRKVLSSCLVVVETYLGWNLMVIKLSGSTSPICLEFDASARLANYPSLNQCLACGPNLIELIPDILQFREREFGFIADIRKAFLQINIRMLCPKIMLQKAWKLGTSCDEELTGELRKELVQWFQELKYLSDIYRFLAAKSRVAPLRGTTIPRLELLAAVFGARLTNSVVEALGWRNVTTYYWSDSTIVLAWILREKNWSVFAWNRFQEIEKLGNPISWRHIPGDGNPADLTSRGCKAKRLVYSRWWEGPQWMKSAFEFQKFMCSLQHDWNEEEIGKERSEASSVLTYNEAGGVENWYYRYFSNYDRIIRLVAWILRFKHNCKNVTGKKHGELTVTEFQELETKFYL